MMLLLLLVCSFLALSVPGGDGTYMDLVVSDHNEFGYAPHNGPATWGERFSTCERGTHQSPININQDECSIDVALPSLSWHDVSRPRALHLKNTWHSVEVTFQSLENRPLLRGGPLKRDYVLSQIHFHWGRGDRGSEHTLRRHFFQMEVHMVHYNTKFTGGIEEASKHPSGLAVVAYFLKGSHTENPEMAELVDSLDAVRQGNATVDLAPSALDWLWRGLDPSTYFTYRGSLTTPPCTEGVVWIVLKRHGHVGISQVGEFRHLRTHDGRMVENRRPTQQLNGRSIVYRTSDTGIYFPGDY